MNGVAILTFEKKIRCSCLDPSKSFNLLQAVMECRQKGKIEVWVSLAFNSVIPLTVGPLFVETMCALSLSLLFSAEIPCWGGHRTTLGSRLVKINDTRV